MLSVTYKMNRRPGACSLLNIIRVSSIKKKYSVLMNQSRSNKSTEMTAAPFSIKEKVGFASITGSLNIDLNALGALPVSFA